MEEHNAAIKLVRVRINSNLWLCLSTQISIESLNLPCFSSFFISFLDSLTLIYLPHLPLYTISAIMPYTAESLKASITGSLAELIAFFFNTKLINR